MRVKNDNNNGRNGSGSTSRPPEKIQEFMNYFSLRIRGYPAYQNCESDAESLIEKEQLENTARFRPRKALEKGTNYPREPESSSGICEGYSRQTALDERVIFSSRKQYQKGFVKPGERARKSGSVSKRSPTEVNRRRSPLEEATTALNTTRISLPPTLKRKQNFSIPRPSNKALMGVAENESKLAPYMSLLASQRQAMTAAKPEKEIPLNVSILEKYLLALPSPSRPSRPSTGEASRERKKSPSPSGRLLCYIGESADLLDTTRREATSNLRRGARKASRYLSQVDDGYESDGSSDSDESFFCIGELNLAELGRARRVSGQGTDPWTDGAQEACRLCRKPSPAGVRGLCLDCEEEFKSPKGMFDDDSSDDNDDYEEVEVKEADDIKPTTPLKIRKAQPAPLKIRKSAMDFKAPRKGDGSPDFQFPSRFSFADSDDEIKPPPPPKDRKYAVPPSSSVAKRSFTSPQDPFSDWNLITSAHSTSGPSPKLGNLERKPILVPTPSPKVHISQCAITETVSDSASNRTNPQTSKFERWQNSHVKASFENHHANVSTVWDDIAPPAAAAAVTSPY